MKEKKEEEDEETQRVTSKPWVPQRLTNYTASRPLPTFPLNNIFPTVANGLVFATAWTSTAVT